MYHFIGIEGAGMSALAVILKGLGYEVKGSDVGKHFFTETELIKNNIPITVYDESNIHEGLIIIKGASITEDNVELIKARYLHLEIIDYEVMLGKLTKEFKTICIAGCHGKTTTTAMTAHVLNQIKGINYLIGDGTGYGNKNNAFFAVESCEYRRHFLNYQPYYAVILNIDLDHVDYYKDINDIISAYQEFANKASKMVIACGDDDNVHKMHLDKRIAYFGLHENNDIRAINIKYQKEGTSFDVIAENKTYGHFDLPIYATHQVLDALAVISICYYENLDSKEVSQCFKTFAGAKRRFTETVCGDSIIVDDYAHHPNEVKATINAARQKYPDKQIITIFQPHTFTRTKEFADELAKVFSEVDAAYIMDIHPARERQEDYPDITKDIIINKLSNGYALTINDADILAKYDNAVFLFMSPNDISKLEDDLAILKANF
jgi:UDP-N-acetylmuramate--alanine ligase